MKSSTADKIWALSEDPSPTADQGDERVSENARVFATKKLGCFTTKNGDLTMTHVDLATKKWRFHHEQLGLNYSKLGMKQERPTCHQEKGWSDLENVIFTCFNSEKGKFVGLNKRKNWKLIIRDWVLNYSVKRGECS